jgi:transposase
VRADAARVQAAARLALPALRVVRGKVRADIALETAVPAPLADGRPGKVLGLDWNVSTFLAGAVVARRRDGSLVRDGRPVFFQAPGWFTADRRRREHAELLAAKAARIQRLTDKRPDERLSAKAERFLAEHAAVHLRRRHANRELARLAARWAVETALAAGCDTIAIEDLGSLEPHVKDAGLNARLSQRLRGQLAKALETACTMAGLRFVPVPPQYTSKTCHRCQGRVRFGRAPDRMTERGWRWALCPSCGLSMDRDVNAAINIATRALREPDQPDGGGRGRGPGRRVRRHRPAGPARAARGWRC